MKMKTAWSTLKSYSIKWIDGLINCAVSAAYFCAH